MRQRLRSTALSHTRTGWLSVLAGGCWIAAIAVSCNRSSASASPCTSDRASARSPSSSPSTASGFTPTACRRKPKCWRVCIMPEITIAYGVRAASERPPWGPRTCRACEVRSGSATRRSWRSDSDRCRNLGSVPVQVLGQTGGPSQKSHVTQSTSRELGEFWHIGLHKRLNDPRESCVESSLMPGLSVPASRAYEPYDRAGRSPRQFHQTSTGRWACISQSLIVVRVIDVPWLARPDLWCRSGGSSSP